MHIIDIQEKDYKNHIKKKSCFNKTTINKSCYRYLKKKEI